MCAHCDCIVSASGVERTYNGPHCALETAMSPAVGAHMWKLLSVLRIGEVMWVIVPDLCHLLRHLLSIWVLWSWENVLARNPEFKCLHHGLNLHQITSVHCACVRREYRFCSFYFSRMERGKQDDWELLCNWGFSIPVPKWWVEEGTRVWAPHCPEDMCGLLAVEWTGEFDWDMWSSSLALWENWLMRLYNLTCGHVSSIRLTCLWAAKSSNNSAVLIKRGGLLHSPPFCSLWWGGQAILRISWMTVVFYQWPLLYLVSTSNNCVF